MLKYSNGSMQLIKTEADRLTQRNCKELSSMAIGATSVRRLAG